MALFLLGSFGYWLVRLSLFPAIPVHVSLEPTSLLQVLQNKCDMDANLRDLLFYTTNALAAHKVPFWLDYGLFLAVCSPFSRCVHH